MPGPARKLDLNELIQRTDAQFEVKMQGYASPDEVASRIRREEREAHHSLWIGTIVKLSVLLGVIGVVGLCLAIAADPRSSADDKRWSTAIVASVVTAAVGFLFGKAIGS